jgi:hypothetical protein
MSASAVLSDSYGAVSQSQKGRKRQLSCLSRIGAILPKPDIRHIDCMAPKRAFGPFVTLASLMQS